MLGVSLSEIRRRDAIGQIRAVKRTSQGWWLYHPADVERLRGRNPVSPLTRKSSSTDYTAEDASKVFDALDAGKTLVQCVKECMVLPEVVERIAVAYARLTGAVLLTKASMDVINELPLEGSFPLTGEAGVVEVLKTAAEETCTDCNKRPKTMCKVCAVKAGIKAVKDDGAGL